MATLEVQRHEQTMEWVYSFRFTDKELAGVPGNMLPNFSTMPAKPYKVALKLHQVLRFLWNKENKTQEATKAQKAKTMKGATAKAKSSTAKHAAMADLSSAYVIPSPYMYAWPFMPKIESTYLPNDIDDIAHPENFMNAYEYLKCYGEVATEPELWGWMAEFAPGQSVTYGGEPV